MNTEEKIVISDISEVVQSAYLDYSMSVIISRALPDSRDGLKPVHRRILYSMYDCGFLYNKPHRKSARTVADVMGKYHPHGDSSIYDAMVRMQQSFSLREPLVDGQGNFGSLDGDMPASMRYTEARLSKIAHSILEDINYETVNFRPNYDGSDQEPVVLPSRFPNLLVNGSSGIAVGMATNVPQHNLSQVIDACCVYVDNPDVDIDVLIDIVEGPDFPVKCTVNKNDLRSAYKTGRGIIGVKGKALVESKNSRDSVVITEIPYSVNKTRLIEKIASLIRESKIEGVSDLRDESDSEGTRIVLDLKNDVSADIVILKLYKLTLLQSTYGVNMLALDGGIPKLMNLKEIIRSFINFRREVIYKRTTFLVNEALLKKEVLGGLFLAVSSIDIVVNTIRNASDSATARKELMEIPWIASSDYNYDDFSLIKRENVYYFSEKQARAILEMRLGRLTSLEKDKIYVDLQQILKDIEYYNSILNSEQKLLNLLKEELNEVKNNFATPRITKISTVGFEDLGVEDLIEEEEMVATFTMEGYVKRVSLDSYRLQKRGGKGKLGLSMSDNDIATNVIVGSTHANLLFFTNIGKVYKIKMYNLPICSLASRGKQIGSIVPLSKSESITNILIFSSDFDSENKNLLFATRSGKVRRNKISDFDYIPSNGKISMKLDPTDELVGVSICEEDDQIFLATDQGKCISFPLSEVRVFKSRTSDGVRGIKLSNPYKVIAQVILDAHGYDYTQREAYLSIKLSLRKKCKNNNQISLDTANAIKNSIKDYKDIITLEKVVEMSMRELFILSVTENGYAKCSSSYEYRSTSRGGSGVLNIKPSSRTGKVIAVVTLKGDEDEELIVVTSLGRTVRVKLKDIRVTGRNTLGVTLVKIAKEEKVVSVARVNDSVSDLIEQV